MQNAGTRMFLLGFAAAGAVAIVACAALFLVYNFWQMSQVQTSSANATATAGAEAVLVRVIQTQNAAAEATARRAATNTPPSTATPSLPPPSTTPTWTSVPTPVPTSTPTLTPRPIPTAVPTFPPSWFSGYTSRELNRRQVQVDVDYFYNGEWGTSNIMVAGLGMTSTGRVFEVNSSAMPIAPGNGHATVNLEIGVPGEWHISKVEMCIYQKDSTVPRSYCQEFPLIKTFWMPTPKP